MSGPAGLADNEELAQILVSHLGDPPKPLPATVRLFLFLNRNLCARGRLSAGEDRHLRCERNQWAVRRALALVRLATLEELKAPSERFPADAIAAAGYDAISHWQRT